MVAESRLVRSARRFCVFAALVGVVALVLWAVGVGLLTAVVAGRPVMTPNTAIGLVALGVAGALRASGHASPWVNRIATAGGAVAFAIGALSLAEYVLAVDLRIDDWHGLQATAHPFRSSPLTVLSFIALGAAQLVFDVRWGRPVHPREALCFVGALFGLTGLIAHAHGPRAVAALAETPSVGIALPTSVSILLIATGYLLARPQEHLMGVVTSTGAGGMLIRRVGLVAIVVPAVLSILLRTEVLVGRLSGEPVISSVLTALLVAGFLFLLTVTGIRVDGIQRSVEETGKRFQSLLELAPDGIFLTRLDGTCTEVNDAGCRLLGGARQDIVGRSVRDFVPENELGEFGKARERMLQGKRIVGEWTMRRRDGTRFPVEVSAKMLPGGVIQSLVRDISERRAVEQRQREAELDQQFLAEAGSVLMASTLDIDETLQNIGQLAVVDLSCRCSTHLVDQKWGARRVAVVDRQPGRPGDVQWLTREQRDALVRRVPEAVSQAAAPELGSGPPQQQSSILVTPGASGSSVAVVPVRARGNLLAVMVLERREDRGRFSTRDLEKLDGLAQKAAVAIENGSLHAAAQSAIQVRDEVLSVVAHDLRNPLNVITVQTEALRRSTEPEKRLGEAADRIQRSVRRMDRLIQDLLEVARLDAGRLELQQVELRAEDLLSDALEAERTALATAGLEPRFDVAPDLPAIVGDRDRLLRVFDNLVGNAVKFTKAGGAVTFGAREDEDAVRFWVADTGSGIPEDFVPHLFDRFRQAHHGDRRGTGLGLPIVQGIVEAHGGKIWVESEVGKGTSVYFTVPRSAARRVRMTPVPTSEIRFRSETQPGKIRRTNDR